jgi:hypothetical protein
MNGKGFDLPMKKIDTNHWQITLPFSSNDTLEYKFTRGSWDKSEIGPQGEYLPNRKLIVPQGSFLQKDVVGSWADIANSGAWSVQTSGTDQNIQPLAVGMAN